MDNIIKDNMILVKFKNYNVYGVPNNAIISINNEILALSRINYVKEYMVYYKINNEYYG